MTGLDAILRNYSQLAVLRVLYHTDQPISGREVERRCGLSNRSTMLALESLLDLHIIHMEPDGRAYLYTLNRRQYFVIKSLKPAFDGEDMFWADFAKTVRGAIRPRPLAAVATGPPVREEREYGGRIMLTLLFNTERSRIKSLRSIQRLAERAKERYSLIIEYQSMDLNTMDKRQYDPLWKRVEREGILLFGTLP